MYWLRGSGKKANRSDDNLKEFERPQDLFLILVQQEVRED